MLRLIALAVACLASALFIAPSARAAPLLYVYEGAGCTGAAALPQFEAFLGRSVDGVTEFVDWQTTPAVALDDMNWALGCWQGAAVANIDISIGLAFAGVTTTQVAAGAADATYTAMAASLVSHGFPKAYVRLGEEMNGGWYPWGGLGKTFAAAFNHVAPLIKAACPGCTVVFDPSAGLDPSSEFPGAANIGAMGWDDYLNSYGSGGKTTEPALFAGDNTNYWGFESGYSSGKGGWYAALGSGPIVPEFGVGSGSNAHGACPLTGANDCDDGYGMAAALSAFQAGGVKLVGYWDYDAGDYNSKISDGSRPQEAIEFLRVFGSPAMQALFAAHGAPFTTQATPTLTVTNCHAVAFQNAPGHWMIVVWATAAHPEASVIWSGKTVGANLYSPSASSPTTAVVGLGTGGAWNGVLTPNKPLVIAVQQ